jgi:hypothetical protein
MREKIMITPEVVMTWEGVLEESGPQRGRWCDLEQTGWPLEAELLVVFFFFLFE